MAAPNVNAVYSGSVTYLAADGVAPTAISLGDDTRQGVLIPVELTTTEVGYKVTQSDNSDFQLNGLTYYYNNLGLF